MMIIFLGEGCPSHNREFLLSIEQALAAKNRYLLIDPHFTNILEAVSEFLPYVIIENIFLPRKAGIEFNKFLKKIRIRFETYQINIEKPIMKFIRDVTDSHILIPAYGKVPIINSIREEKWLETISILLKEILNTIARNQTGGKEIILIERSTQNPALVWLSKRVFPESKTISVISDRKTSLEHMVGSNVNGMDVDDAESYFEYYKLCCERQLNYIKDKESYLEIQIEEIETNANRVLEFIETFVNSKSN